MGLEFKPSVGFPSGYGLVGAFCDLSPIEIIAVSPRKRESFVSLTHAAPVRDHATKTLAELGRSTNTVTPAGVKGRTIFGYPQQCPGEAKCPRPTTEKCLAADIGT